MVNLRLAATGPHRGAGRRFDWLSRLDHRLDRASIDTVSVASAMSAGATQDRIRQPLGDSRRARPAILRGISSALVRDAVISFLRPFGYVIATMSVAGFASGEMLQTFQDASAPS